MSNNKNLKTRGRPPKYKTPEDLENRINEYFKKPKNQYKGVATITDLCEFLGFADRSALDEIMEAKPHFTRAVKRAKNLIAREYESHLLKQNYAGAIFALKNFGWRDDFNLGGNLNINYTLSALIAHVKSKDIGNGKKDSRTLERIPNA